MNDADLEKLGIKPGRLDPVFNRNVTEYSVTLPSNTTKLTINPVTRDSDASWTLLTYGNNRIIPLNSGEEKDLVIEVTAEDGSTNRYTIHVLVLSASNATLTDIKVSHGSLTPSFRSDILDYAVHLPWHLAGVMVLPEATDKDTSGANKSLEVNLNYGETLKVLKVKSPDKTCTIEYQIRFIKDRILRMITLTDFDDSKCCKICLGLLHCPVSIMKEQEDKKRIIFCRKCVDLVTRTRKFDPFTEVQLTNDFVVKHYDIEQELSNLKVFCCYKHLGCTEEVDLCQLGNHMKGCSLQPILASTFEGIVAEKQIEKLEKIGACKMCSHSVPKDDIVTHLKWYCPAKHPNTKISHIVELRNWEKKLQEKGPSIPTDPNVDFQLINKGDASQLEIAAETIAVIIKMKPRNPVNHFKLGTVLEEMYYAEDIWGCKRQTEVQQDEDKMFDNMMDVSSDSSMEDEIKAICNSKGLGHNAPLPLILKALDEEYHDLLNQNQSAKADYAQKLFCWKSKQARGNMKPAVTTVDDGYLSKALLKYLDASACDPNSSSFHMHVGRLLLMQGKYEDAIKRLEPAFGLKPTGIEARFYLGLAYVKHYGRQHSIHLNPIKYLQDGVDYALYKLCEDPDVEFPRCSAQIFVRHSNTLIVEGMLELAHLLREKESLSDREKSMVIEMYRQTSCICIQMMYGIVHRNKTFQQLFWVAMRAQFSLGKFMTNELKQSKCVTPEKRKNVHEFWERLFALTRTFEPIVDNNVLRLQRKICEEAVILCPSSSQSLYRLGDAQFALYEHDSEINEDLLKQAENSYRASIQFEGKRIQGKEVSWMIKDSKWWKIRQEKEKKTQPKPIKTQPKVTTPSQNKPASNQAKSIVKGSSTTKGASKVTPVSPTKPTATKNKGSLSMPKGKSSISPSSSAKGKTAIQFKKDSSNSKVNAAVANKRSGQALVKSTSSAHAGACCAAKTSEVKPSATPKSAAATESQGKEEANKDEKVKQSNDEDDSLNVVSFQSRLGLARVLSRDDKDFNWGEIEQLYTDVVKLAPQVHDAYIELAEMVAVTEPKQAIAIYCKYPFKDDLSFDDAYLHGEIFRLLTKIEDFDNPNLEKSMIKYGKVMGFSSLDKTVTILENKFKYDTLRKVYASIIDKDVNDKELQDFFKFKCWV